MSHGKSEARTRRSTSGVALIEALVALLVMAFGMVAVAGLMSTMRRSADLAKQRGDALRIAQQQMETWRDFSVLATPTGLQRDYSNNVSTSLPASQITVTNTVYTLTPQVTPFDATDEIRARAVRMTVTWPDRAGENQWVTTDSVIARLDPSLAGALSIAPVYTATQRPPDGKSSVPPSAQDLGGGKSAVIPQPGGTIAFIFDNLTGVVTSRCTISAGTRIDQIHSTADLTDCSSTYGFLLWGYVNFADASPLTAANLASSMAASYAQPLDMGIAATPTSTSAPAYECFDNGPTSATDPRTQTQNSVAYVCVVTPVAVSVQTTIRSTGTTIVYTWAGGTYTRTASTPTAQTESTKTSSTTAWFGRLDVGGIVPDTGTSTWEVCRYSGDYDGDGTISNSEHPLNYLVVEGALGNQNFLVIRSTATCPTGANGTSGIDFFKTATVAHQPNGIETPTTAH